MTINMIPYNVQISYLCNSSVQSNNLFTMLYFCHISTIDLVGLSARARWILAHSLRTYFGTWNKGHNQAKVFSYKPKITIIALQSLHISTRDRDSSYLSISRVASIAIVMLSLYHMHEMNTYRTGCVCLLERFRWNLAWTLSHWNTYPNIILINYLQSRMLTLQAQKRLRCECHFT
jgi:hypothetical protein